MFFLKVNLDLSFQKAEHEKKLLETRTEIMEMVCTHSKPDNNFYPRASSITNSSSRSKIIVNEGVVN